MPVSIRTSTTTCYESFEKCLLAVKDDTLHKDLINEYGRLRIWAGSIGAYAKSAVSADARLQDDVELRELALTLLDGLAVRLQFFVMKLNNAFLETDDFEDSSSSSDDSLVVIESMNSFSPRYGAKVIGHIRLDITQLFSLLKLVRKPSSLTSGNKVYLHDFEKELGEEGFTELITEFESFVRWYLEHRYQEALTALMLERLVASAVIRRKALVLKKRHTRKMEGISQKQTQEMPRSFFQSQSMPDVAPVRQQSRDRTETMSSTLPSVAVLSTVAAPSTTASAQQRVGVGRTQPKPRSSKSVVMQRKRLDIPAPPKVSENQDEIQCYICGLIIDQETASPDRWSAHVLSDIDPFICLYPDCEKGDMLFKKSSQWQKHMQNHRQQWVCRSPAHDTMIFQVEADFEQHIMSEHALKSSKVGLDRLREQALKVSNDILEDCPLCGDALHGTTEDVDLRRMKDATEPVADGKARQHQLLRHVESHLYEIALLSLLPSEEHLSSSTGSGAADHLHADLHSDEDGSVEWGSDRASNEHLPLVLLEDFNLAEEAGQVPEGFFTGEESDKTAIWRDFVLVQAAVPPATEESAQVETEDSTQVESGNEVERGSAQLSFQRIRRIGQGSFSTVYEVRDPATGTCYASKSVPVRPTIGQSVDVIENRIKHEMDIMRMLQHKHIASFVFYSKDQDFWNILMLPIADCNLQEYLDEHCVAADYPQSSVKPIYQWFGCLISALSYAHLERVKHEDIKPSNILIKNAQVYLTDFGTAKDFSDLESSVTEDYMLYGTLVYWPPEPRPWGRQADVFSLGCVFAEMLTVCLGKSLSDFRSFRSNPASDFRYAYRSSLSKTRRWLKNLYSLDRDPCLLLVDEQILNMLIEDSSERLDARRIRRNLRAEEDLFCASCF